MQRYVWLFGLLGLLAALPGSRTEAQSQPGKSASVKSYSTRFQIDEDPISEGGKWINGAKEGVDWYNVITKNGVAYLNGVEVITATDKTYATGNPGMGFNYGVGKTNADFGFSSYEVDSYND